MIRSSSAARKVCYSGIEMKGIGDYLEWFRIKIKSAVQYVVRCLGALVYPHVIYYHRGVLKASGSINNRHDCTQFNILRAWIKTMPLKLIWWGLSHHSPRMKTSSELYLQNKSWLLPFNTCSVCRLLEKLTDMLTYVLTKFTMFLSWHAAFSLHTKLF